MGYWPPRQGPRVKGFESGRTKLVALPFVGDLQTLTYRNDVYTDGPLSPPGTTTAKGGRASPPARSNIRSSSAA